MGAHVIHVVLQRVIEPAILRGAPTGGGSRQSDHREGLRSAHRVILGDAVRVQRVLTAEGERAEGRRAEPGERLLKRLARDTRVNIRALGCQRLAVVLDQGFQTIADFSGLRIEEGLKLEYPRPIHEGQRLFALQADPRLAQVAGRNSGHRAIAVLLHDCPAARGIIIVDRSHMTVVLQADVDNAVQGDAVPGQAVVAGGSTRRGGARTLRLCDARCAQGQQNRRQKAKSARSKAAAAAINRCPALRGNFQVKVTHKLYSVSDY